MRRRLGMLLSRFGLDNPHRGDDPHTVSAFERSEPVDAAWIPGLSPQPGSRSIPTADIIRIIRDVQPNTMTSPERIHALCRAVEYIVSHQIEGDMVECGVWRGGSMFAVARMLLGLGETDRTLHLFDTFNGMTPPTDRDVDYLGSPAAEQLANEDKGANLIQAACSLDAVRAVMATSRYDADRIRYVQGSVEETLPDQAPGSIALLRLDTDWYASTRHELTHLYPRLVKGGVLIIDDYGHWRGAREAVDEYFRQHAVPMQLHRIDYTGRIGIRQDDGDGP